jgi:hypothetical protein
VLVKQATLTQIRINTIPICHGKKMKLIGVVDGREQCILSNRFSARSTYEK